MKITKKSILSTALTLVTAAVVGFGTIGCYRPDEGYTAVDPGELPAKIDGFDYKAAQLERYESPITVTVAAVDYPLEGNVKEGTTPYNQSFNKIVKDVLNINLEYKVVATSANYGSRLDTAIASDREPDMFYADASAFASLKDNGRLRDLGPSFWYLNEELQNIYLNVMPDVLKSAMIEGKLYAFPVATNTYESAQKLYIRKDWLDICGEAVPEELTMDEFIALGEKFIANGDKIVSGTGLAGDAKQLIPLAMHNDVMGTGTAGAAGLMQAFGASPNAYFLDDNGELYSSNTSREMKSALSVMADMYKKGIIDKQFKTKNVDMVYDDIRSGKVGMVFGQWWLPNGEINNTVSNITGADWACVELPSYGNKAAQPIVKRVNLTGYNCVSSKCKYPEAAAKIINLFYDVYYNDNAEAIYGADVKPENGFYYNMVPIKLWNAISSVEEYKRVNGVFKAAYEKGVRISYGADNKLTEGSWKVLSDAEVNALDSAAKQTYNARFAEYNKLKTREKELHWDYGYPYYCAVKAGAAIKDMPALTKRGWGIYNCMIADDCGYDYVTKLTEGKLSARYDEFYGPTLSMMEEYGGYILTKLSPQAYMQIIAGEKPVSYFDEYVVEYNKNGGDKIINQVNLWYKAQPHA